LAVAVALTAAIDPASGQRPPMSRPAAAIVAGSPSAGGGIHIASGRTTSFMWVLTDASGYRWDISSNGTISDGTSDAYDTGMQLQVDGASFPGYSTGKLSQDGAEVEIGPWKQAGLAIYRRVCINVQAGYCRWIDIFENSSSDKDVTASLKYYFNMGESTRQTYTSSGAAELTDKDWGIVTAGSSRTSSRPAIVHVFGSPGAKFKPAFQFDRSNDNIYYHASIKVPAGKTVAICFFEAQRRPYESAVKFLKDFKPRRELALVPAPLRKILLNMTGASLLLGEIELKRSDKYDLVSLRNGDEIRGQITTAKYALRTGFGAIEVPAGEVIGLVSRSAEKDLVKLVLAGGQVVAGELTNGPLAIRLPGGTELKVPPRGIRQAAYKISEKRPEQVRTTDSLVLLRRGERLAFDDSGLRFAFLTSHGALDLAAEDLSAIEMDTPGGGLHRAVFRNGSLLAGLLGAERIGLKLKLGPSAELPRWQLGRILFAAEELEPAGLSKLTLRNGDVLYGTFSDKKWAIQTKLGKVEVVPADVASGQSSANSLGHVQLVLRTGTKIGGKLADDYVGFQVKPGPAMKIFVGKIGAFVGAEPAKPATSEEATSSPSTRTGAADGSSEAPAIAGKGLPELEKLLRDRTVRMAATQRALAEVKAKLAAVNEAGLREQLAKQAGSLMAELNKLQATIAQIRKQKAVLTQRG